MPRKRSNSKNDYTSEEENFKPVSQRKNKKHPNSDKHSVIITALNEEQKNLIKTISANTITFIKGSPGSGKTHISVGLGIQGLLNNKYKTLVFSRPVVEASGEKLGFLPGDANHKISPFMMPIFYSLEKIISSNLIKKLTDTTDNHPKIRIIPLAFMRGITVENAFVVIDEAQNVKVDQMRMILTRLGKNSKMVFCGDVEQSDIRMKNGLYDAFERFQDIKKIGFVTLSEGAIVRSELIKTIENRYKKNEQRTKGSQLIPLRPSSKKFLP